jgi:hypothetical protein
MRPLMDMTDSQLDRRSRRYLQAAMRVLMNGGDQSIAWMLAERGHAASEELKRRK